jgi:hypothetical protein
MSGRVVVTGGRTYADRDRLYAVLSAVWSRYPGCTLVEGGALGADRLAREWARANAVAVETVVANWATHGKSAGPRRNREMLELPGVRLVVAFPGGRGTAHAVATAKGLGLKVRHA